jgi:hypothetical protein
VADDEEIPDETDISELAEAADPVVAKSKLTRRNKAAAVMLISGATPQEIADTLDYVTASQAKDAAYGVIGNTFRPGVDYAAFQQLAGARLEAVMKAVAPLALNRYVEVDDPKTGKKKKVRNEEQFPALREYRGAVTDWIKLYGLQAPTRVEIQTPAAQEFAAVVGQLVELAKGPSAIEGDIFADVIEDDEDEEENA